MAWSEAARQAAAAVRRLHAQERGNFHAGGTPRFDPVYVTTDYRRQAARKLKEVRRQARQGIRPGHAQQVAIREAAMARSMQGHPLNPGSPSVQNSYTAGLAAKARADFDRRGRARVSSAKMNYRLWGR